MTIEDSLQLYAHRESMKCPHIGKLGTFIVSFVLGSIVDLFYATAMASVVFYTLGQCSFCCNSGGIHKLLGWKKEWKWRMVYGPMKQKTGVRHYHSTALVTELLESKPTNHKLKKWRKRQTAWLVSRSTYLTRTNEKRKKTCTRRRCPHNYNMHKWLVWGELQLHRVQLCTQGMTCTQNNVIVNPCLCM